MESNGFDDALLVDPDGNVVYSAYKGVDLGTNLLTGPYKDSGLESAFLPKIVRDAIDRQLDTIRIEPGAFPPGQIGMREAAGCRPSICARRFMR